MLVCALDGKNSILRHFTRNGTHVHIFILVANKYFLTFLNMYYSGGESYTPCLIFFMRQRRGIYNILTDKPTRLCSKNKLNKKKINISA